MGRSAKLHKRVKKTKSNSNPSSNSAASSSSQPQAAAAQAKKKANLKSKAKGGKSEGLVLGGADYVSLLMGGRRKAKEEAMKLPASED